ncbi:MAG: universal stress protein [Alphaproteobacteria bacterium]
MFQSILVPIDIEHRSSWEFAIPEALELARPGRAKLAVMTVVLDVQAMLRAVHLPYQLEDMVNAAQRRMAAIVKEYEGPGIEIEQVVRFGSIGREILNVAKDRAVDLIVMASHRPEMRDYLIGPNAAHVSRHAACSVLVLRKFKDASR